jgi:predicted transcriptional regulator
MKGAKNPALSRMEIYLAVIKVLDNGDVITLQQIIRKAGLKSITISEFMDFLVKLDLIKEKNVDNKMYYFITEKGQRLVAYFGLDDENEIFGGTGIFRID